MKISLIAAVDENNGIGKNNKLLCYLPADLQHFKQLTLGKTIIMGRKTFESIGKPLPDRQNIVLSRHKNTIEGVEIAQSFVDALSLVKTNNDIMVIGGEKVFEEAFTFAVDIYLTLIHYTFDADVFFPPINPLEWLCIEEIHRKRDEKNHYDMTFLHYQRPILPF